MIQYYHSCLADHKIFYKVDDKYVYYGGYMEVNAKINEGFIYPVDDMYNIIINDAIDFSDAPVKYCSVRHGNSVVPWQYDISHTARLNMFTHISCNMDYIRIRTDGFTFIRKLKIEHYTKESYHAILKEAVDYLERHYAASR